MAIVTPAPRIGKTAGGPIAPRSAKARPRAKKFAPGKAARMIPAPGTGKPGLINGTP